MSGHYLYVIAFSDNVVKVGRTHKPRTRLNSHVADARKREAEVIQTWFSPAGSLKWLATCNEKQLIDYCLDRWPLAWGREFFAGADFARVSGYAAGLRGIETVDCQGGHCRQTYADERPSDHMDAERMAQWLGRPTVWVLQDYRTMPHHHCGSAVCFTSQELIEGLQLRGEYPRPLAA